MFFFCSFKVNLGSDEASGLKAQTCLYPEAYQGNDQWHCYTTEKQTAPRLIKMASRLHAMGVNRGTEKTFAKAAAIALCNDGLKSSADSLKDTRALKAFFLQMPHETLTGPMSYPSDVTEFKVSNEVLWDQLQVHGPVVDSRLDSGDAAVLKAAAPCRNTKTGCVNPDEKTSKRLKLTDQVGKCPKPLMEFLENMATPQLKGGGGPATFTLPNGHTFTIDQQDPAIKPGPTREVRTPVGVPQFVGPGVSPPLATGYFMESGIGYSHSQSHL